MMAKSFVSSCEKGKTSKSHIERRATDAVPQTIIYNNYIWHQFLLTELMRARILKIVDEKYKIQWKCMFFELFWSLFGLVANSGFGFRDMILGFGVNSGFWFCDTILGFRVLSFWHDLGGLGFSLFWTRFGGQGFGVFTRHQGLGFGFFTPHLGFVSKNI